MESPERTEKVARALLCMQRHSWEQGLAMQAFYEMGDMETVAVLGREAVFRSMPDGRLATIGVTDAVTDPCSVGESLLAAARETGDSVLQQGVQSLLEWALKKAPRSPVGVLYHLNTSRQFWVDSFYMLPPFLAAAGYYHEALVNLYGYWDALYDPDAGLLRQIWDEEAQTFVNPSHWGTGNGWAMAGIARVIGLLPAEYEADRQRLIQMAHTLIEHILPLRMQNGMLHNVLDDPESFQEINAVQMLSYTLFRGVEDGWLPEEKLSLAYDLRETAQQKVDSFGFVREACGAPTFDKSGVSPEAQAFHLLMEAAAKRAAGRHA